METSRERVLKAIDHIQPEVTPVRIMGPVPNDKWLERFGAKDTFELRDKLGLDFQSASAVYAGPRQRERSIWGVALEILGLTGAGYSNVREDFPLARATSVADIERFPWPDPDEFDYDVAARILHTVPDKARYVRTSYTVEEEGFSREDAARGGTGGDWLPIICTLFNLFGLEETLIRLHTAPKLIEATVAHVESFVMEFSRRLLEATQGTVDIFWLGDDFSTQRGILISPDHWRRLLKPTYKKLFDLGKSYGLKVWFHSCGTFRAVLPDLIDIGMDVWETVQVHLPGNEPEVLKREYGQDIAFYGAINTQYTLPLGTPEDVRAEVRERIRVLGKGGGYICGSDHSILPDVPFENVLAMLDEARRFSP